MTQYDPSKWDVVFDSPDPVVQAAQIAEALSVTACPADYVCFNLGINTSSLAGKKVLDVASGFSGFVADCNAAGADAYGVDTNYGRIDFMAERARRFLRYQVKTGLQPAELAHLPPELAKDAIKQFAAMCDDSVVSRFLAEIDKNPQSYVEGSSTSLPFEAESFDIVTCHSLLTSEAGLGQEFVSTSLQEILRVLKRSSSTRIGVNHFDEPKSLDQSKQIEANLRRAFDEARDIGVADKFSRYMAGKDAFYYIITKARKLKKA